MQLETPSRGDVYNSITINVTNRCNTYCKYCFQDAQNIEQDLISLTDIRRILSYFRDKRGKKDHCSLQLTGGEIFLRSDIFDIIKSGLEYGFGLRLQTNGMLINRIPEERLRILSSDQITIKVSLDGWKPEIHEEWRAKGSFKKVVKGIKKLREYSRNIGIKTVIHSKNFPQIQKMLEICNKLGARSFTYNILRSEGRARQYEFEEISEEEVIDKLLFYLRKERFQHLINGTEILRYHLGIPEGSNVLLENKPFYVDYNGGIYPNQTCDESERIGSVFYTPLKKQFDENKLVTEKKEVSGKTMDQIRAFFQNL